MDYTFDYSFKENIYKVIVTRKRIKNAHFRFRNNEFIVSTPWLFSKERVIKCLDKFAESLISRNDKTNMEKEDCVYIFGVKYPLDEKGKFIYNGYEFSGAEDFEIRCKKSIRNIFESRVREYEKYMNVPEYKVRIQKMTSRYGSNSKRTHTLNFSINLVHYSWPIIDSVIVHELAHYYEFNHSKNFYDVVYKYYPKYDYYQRFLKKGQFHD